MSRLKLLGAIGGVAMALAFATPASAGTLCSAIGDSCTVTNVTWGGSDGTGYDGEGYAGLITFSITGVGNIKVLCDDLNHYVYGGAQSNLYYLEDATYYLRGSLADGNLTGLSASTAQQIIGLAFAAELGGGFSATQLAQLQSALWIMEYGNVNGHTTLGDPGVTFFTSQASYYYSLFLASGYSVYELEAPFGNCAGLLSHITFNSDGTGPNNCQVQGQLVFGDSNGHHPPPVRLPEPGTLGLLGIGLMGLGGLRLRRKAKTKTA